MASRDPRFDSQPSTQLLRRRLDRMRHLVRREILSLQAEGHYQAVMDGLQEGVLFVDREGLVLNCNPSAERILGLPFSELRGRTTTDAYVFSAVHEDGTPFKHEDHPSRRALSDGRPCVDVVQGLVREGEIIRWVRINAIPLHTGGILQGVAVSLVDITRAKQLEERLRHEAVRDELTGLYNRRYLLEQVPRAQNAARRHGYGTSLCICDLDHFKRVNDTYGHAVGDLAICAFGQLLASHIRREDLVARYGGDEFCILFTHSSAEQARVVLERMRLSVSELRLPYADGELDGFTASFGVANSRDELLPPGQLLEAADQALYRAKAEGRNRVVVGS